MENDEMPLGKTVGSMMNKMVRVLRRSFADSGIDISIDQFALLHAISVNKEEVVQQDMAEILGKDKSAILRLIDGLESKNLVVRTSDLQDRRKNVLSVTPSGVELIGQVTKIVSDINKEFRKGISPEEFETFLSVVKRVKANAEAML